MPPNTFTHVPFGPHQLSATLEDYEPIKQDIQVRRGMSPQIRLQLKPIQEIAALSVQTEPSGASILLDGKPPQVPPNTFTHVPFGPHQLSATLDDHEPIKQDIEVRRGMSPEIRLQLKQIQQIQEIAALSIQTEPTGASILLDGKPPQAPPDTFTHVPFGPHQLSATLDNYEPIKQDIQVRKGMNPEIQSAAETEPGERTRGVSSVSSRCTTGRFKCDDETRSTLPEKGNSQTTMLKDLIGLTGLMMPQTATWRPAHTSRIAI